jgi:Zn-finger protein
MQPKDIATSNKFMFFQNKECPFFMCHKGVKEENFNCLFCYCPLIFLKCPGPYKVFTDKNGFVRKDCTDCKLPHNKFLASWKFIQKWLEKPIPWDNK